MRRLARYVFRRRKRGTEHTRGDKFLIFDFDGRSPTLAAAVTILNTLAGEFDRPLQPIDSERARDMRTRQLMKF
jgi:hypothetical protein